MTTMTAHPAPDVPAILEAGGVVEAAIQHFDACAARHRAAVTVEAQIEADRPAAKGAAIRRIMGDTNPDTGKPHSYSSAERVVELDAEYAAYLSTQREAVSARNEAWAAQESARYRVRLALALLEAAHA